MVGRKRSAPQRQQKSVPNNDQGSIYSQLLAEAGVHDAQASSASERPVKRLRPGERRPEKLKRGSIEPDQASKALKEADREEEENSDDDVEFFDVELPVPTVQTFERESEDEDDDYIEDAQFEDIDFTAIAEASEPKEEQSKDLELNLTAQRARTTPTKRAGERKKPITKEERDRRTDIHKTHLLCLLSHAARRNHWCNDKTVQDMLRPHLADKMVYYLTPGSHLPQFGQAESLKTGLKQAGDMWRTKFEVRERGLRRARWAEDADDLQHYELPDDLESCMDRQDFRDAASKLHGSRDVGAQLYCALLRSVGVRARLVCSLQPLGYGPGAPTLPKPSKSSINAKKAKTEASQAQVAKYKQTADAVNAPVASGSTARKRLGHPLAASYDFEPTASPPKRRPTFEGPRKIRESAYPVYWVEILDTGHQKWQPVDAVVTHTFWKPKVLEPPITHKENMLNYVVAFEADGTAKDVTIRYAKAYAAKTRRMRVDGGTAEGGTRWWQAALKRFRRHVATDLDQIEAIELAGMEAREPMPRNVQDFKDHPVFALERHLRRHEVLVPTANPSGTVAAGSRAPLEKVYRRKDVRIARTADKWHRLGREVKPNEIPAKWLPKKKKLKHPDFEDEGEEADDAGVPIYTEDQTELYEPPPVRDGKVPKNKFGNVEVYVPSMIPSGAIHIVHEHAARAAYTIGADYAPALTGFQFKGRHGTAVLNGIVVAEEYEDAIQAVIAGLNDVEQQLEEERKALAALKLWRRLLMGLRIRERIWSGVDPEERKAADKEAEAQAALDEEMADAPSDVTEEFEMEDDEGGGGFLIE